MDYPTWNTRYEWIFSSQESYWWVWLAVGREVLKEPFFQLDYLKYTEEIADVQTTTSLGGFS